MYKLLAFSIINTIVAVSFGLLLPYKWIAPAVHHTGYYFIFLAFTLWSVYVIRFAASHAGTFIKTHYPAIILSIVLVGLIFHLSPPKFKVLADETNLMGVSLAMNLNQKASLPVSWLALDYAPDDYSYVIDKRPLLYPLILSIAHSIVGYSPSNGFGVNFILSILVLLTFYLLVKRSINKFYAIIAIIFMASHPNFIFWVTSSGFETLNLFLVLFVFLMMHLYLKDREPFYAELMLFSMILLAQTRYESIIFFIGLFLLIPQFADRKKLSQYNLIISITPLLFIPFIWQRRISFFDATARKGSMYITPIINFSLGYLKDNFSKNIFVFSGLDSTYGFILIISILSVIGGCFLLKKFILYNKQWGLIENKIFLFGLSTFCILFILYGAFYFGDFGQPESNRFALIFLPYIIFAAVYGIQKLFQRNLSQNKQILLLSLSLFQLAYFWPIAANQRLVNDLSLTYEYDRIVKYLNSHFDVKNEKILIISDLPNLYIVQHLGAVDFGFANYNIDKLKTLHRTYYDHILVIQRFNLKTNSNNKDNYLNSAYPLDPLIKFKVSPDNNVNISEINNIL